jgi:hypothetical protein
MARGRKPNVEKDSTPAASNLLMQLRDNALKDLSGTSILTVDQFMDSIYGIPIHNNLPLQHMLGVDVLALGRALTLVGAAGTSKSSLGWYMAKLIMEAGGFVVFIDSEQKTNPDQVRAIIDNDELYRTRLLPTKVYTIDQMLGSLKYYAQEYSKLVPKRDVPMMFLIDSLNGITSQDTKDKLDKDEELGYDNARTVAKLQAFFQMYLPNYLDRNPFLLVMINHRKKDIEQPKYGGVTSHEPGGTHKDFMYTWRLEMSKMGNNESVDGMTPIYKMKVLKSSLGQTYSHSLEIPYESYIDDTGLEHIRYNWDTALVNLLNNDKISKNAIAEVMHLRCVGKKCTSKTLGLEDVSPAEMGKAIHANPELCKLLQERVLRIRRKRKFGNEPAPETLGSVSEEHIESGEEAGGDVEPKV